MIHDLPIRLAFGLARPIRLLGVAGRTIEEERIGWRLALADGFLVALVGLAAAVRSPQQEMPAVLIGTASCALGVGGSLLIRGRLAGIAATVLAMLALTIYSYGVVAAAPTVVWLFAFVVPVLGLVRGPSHGALAGLLAAPALHWIETGIPFDPFDPQTPFGILILVALGAVPGYLVKVAVARQAALDVELTRTASLLVEASHARQAEAQARHHAVFMLARAAEARDGTTGVHIHNVRDLARELALRVGLPPAEAEQIGWSGMLHDVGKLRVPDRVLLKPGRLDPSEWEIVKQHPLWGEELLRGDDGFRLARAIARSHHENWDGTGYPDGLRGELIPFAARVVRVVDVFDALRSERPYKPVWPLDRVIDEMLGMRGTGLDPGLTQVFLESLRAGPGGG